MNLEYVPGTPVGMERDREVKPEGPGFVFGRWEVDSVIAAEQLLFMNLRASCMIVKR